jgi:hypothetical protein
MTFLICVESFSQRFSSVPEVSSIMLDQYFGRRTSSAPYDEELGRNGSLPGPTARLRLGCERCRGVCSYYCEPRGTRRVQSVVNITHNERHQRLFLVFILPGTLLASINRVWMRPIPPPRTIMARHLPLDPSRRDGILTLLRAEERVGAGALRRPDGAYISSYAE